MSKNYLTVVDITPIGSTEYSTTYTPAKAVDGDLTTYWRPTNADTVRSLTFALGSSRVVDKIRLYLSSSYSPSSCVISGSNDGSIYTDIATVTPTQTTGWVSLTFTNTTGYAYYKVAFPSLYSSYLYLYSIELWYVSAWSKADGLCIGITFTEEIISDITAQIGVAYEVNSGVVSSVSSGSSPLLIANGNYTDYGYTNNSAGAWIKLKLSSAKRAYGMRWYVNSANYGFNSFTVSGSNDNGTFTDIATLTDTATTGWKEFSFDSLIPYLYYKFTASTYYGPYFFCNEIELRTAGYSNEAAFTVTGKEYNFVPGGVLQDMVYTVESVVPHPSLENSILITIVSNDRFESIVGNLTVAYDSSKGNLAGYGGPVSSFSQVFTPLDLISKPDQNDQNHVALSSIVATGTLIQVYYTNAKEEEHIELLISATGTLTNINDL